jgi:hypothetical protein
MDLLEDVRHAQRVHPFGFWSADGLRVECSLLVHPARQWAIATELCHKAYPSLQRCQAELAAALQRTYGLAPAALTLFIRYAYGPGCATIYVTRFDPGQAAGPGRQPLVPRQELLAEDEAAQLIQSLVEDRAPAPYWRARHESAPQQTN